MIKELLEKYKRKRQLIEYFKGPKEFRKRCKVVETEDKIYCYLKGGLIRKVDNGDNYIDLRKNREMKNIPNIDKPIIYVIENLNKRSYKDLYIQGHADELIIRNSKLSFRESDIVILSDITNLTFENSRIEEVSLLQFEVKGNIFIKNSFIVSRSSSFKAHKIEIQDSNINIIGLSFNSAIIMIKNSIVEAINARFKIRRYESDCLSLLELTEQLDLQIEKSSNVAISIPKGGKIICNGRNVEHTGGCISLQTTSNETQSERTSVTITPKKMPTVDLRREQHFGRGLRRGIKN